MTGVGVVEDDARAVPYAIKSDKRTFHYVGEGEGKSNGGDVAKERNYWLGGVVTSCNTTLRYMRSASFCWSGLRGALSLMPSAARER